MAHRKVAEMVLNPVQMFDQKVAAARCAAEKGADLLEGFRVDLAAFRKKRRWTAFLAGSLAVSLVASSNYLGVRRHLDDRLLGQKLIRPFFGIMYTTVPGRRKAMN